MGRSADVVTGFGWVLDHWEGDYPAKLQEVLGDEDVDLYELVDDARKNHGIDVEYASFGLEGRGKAMFAAQSVKTSYDWEHRFAKLDPDTSREREHTVELNAAIEQLGWRAAELGPPSWLLLVSYG